MNYDNWKSTEPDLSERYPKSESIHYCHDCGDEAHLFSSSVLVGDRWRLYCRQCKRWRDARGLTFDPRHRNQLESEVA